MSRYRRRDSELASLFGRELVQRAKATDPACLDLTEELMEAVHDGADRLLALAGFPLGQRQVVEELDPEIRLVLCMWVQDMDLAAKLTAEVLKRAA